MRTSKPARRTARRLLSAAVILLLLPGCRVPGQSPSPTPSSPGSTPRPFTVMSTDPIRVTDPAAMTDPASAVLALNVFQRLMTADPGGAVLKPDAARDCLFTAATTYTCTLNEELLFHNGHPVTSADVKFSIERSTRLNVAGSSASLLSSLRKIETPDEMTVRFLLSRPDTQFGWALASPAASIVDDEVYDADRVHEPEDPIMGSGPFQVTSFSPDQVQLTRNDKYVGRTAGRLQNLVYRRVADSPSIEDAMTKGTVDVVWRGLDSAAVTRLGQQVQESPDQQTISGYSETVLTGKRVLQLGWSPTSPMRRNKALRTAIAQALQGDRTLDSVVPGGVPGHAASFPLGGKVTPKVTWKNRINLTLGYDPSTPNGQDIAIQIRTRLENTGGLSVKLLPELERRSDAPGPQGVDGDRGGLDAALPRRTAAQQRRVGQLHRNPVPRHHRRRRRRPVARQTAAADRHGPGVAADEPVRREGLHSRRSGDVGGVLRTGLAAWILGPGQWLSWLRRWHGPGSGSDPSGSGSGSR